MNPLHSFIEKVRRTSGRICGGRRAWSGFILSVAICFCGCFLVAAGLCFAQKQQRDTISEDTAFSAALLKAGFPDYARKVADRLATTTGGSDPRLKILDVKSRIVQKKFAEAGALLDGMDTSKYEIWEMILDAADTYFSYGMWDETEKWYDKFMRAFPDPSAQYAASASASAYKYAQLLKSMKKEQKALGAYEYALKTKPEDQELGQMYIEMGQLCLRLAMRAPENSAERTSWLTKANDFAQKVQWMGWERVPVWFGKSVVILAQIESLKGKKKEAWALIGTYETILQQIHDELRKIAEENKDEDILRLTPMAECRFLKGSIMYDQAMDLLAKGKVKEGKLYLKGALDDLFPVFVLYPSTAWATQAGKRVQDIFDEFDRMGVKYTKPPNFRLVEVLKIQLREARMYMMSGGYDEAIDKFVEILSLFPEFPGESAMAVADTAECLYKSSQFDSAKAVTGYLVERFKRHPNPRFVQDSGDALMYLAKQRKDAGDGDTAREMFDLMVVNYPKHPQRSLVLLYLGDLNRERGDYDGAIRYLKQVVNTNDAEYAQALNSLTFAYKQKKDYTNEVATLREYVKVAKKGKDSVQAMYRLGAAYLSLNDATNAAVMFNYTIKMIGDPAYNTTAVDQGENKKLTESALYNTATACSKIKDGPKAVEFQKKAIELFGSYVKQFPDSQFAPGALLRKGIMETVVKEPVAAAASFKMLESKYPASQERTSMYYLNIKILLEMGQVDDAKNSMKQMLENAGKYSSTQFMATAGMLVESKDPALAGDFYRQALKDAKDPVADRWILERGNFELGRIYFNLNKYPEASECFNKLFTLYPQTGYTLDACFMYARSLSAVGEKTKDNKEQMLLFNKAVDCLNKVTKLLQNPQFKDRQAALSPKVAYEVCLLYEAKARAAEANGNNEDAAKARGGANMGYLRLFQYFDHKNPDAREYIEEAFRKLVPYEMDAAKADADRYGDIVKFCKSYLADFPDGKYVKEAGQWLNEAQGKAPAGSDKSDEEESAPAKEATGATNAISAKAGKPAGE